MVIFSDELPRFPKEALRDRIVVALCRSRGSGLYRQRARVYEDTDLVICFDALSYERLSLLHPLVAQAADLGHAMRIAQRFVQAVQRGARFQAPQLAPLPDSPDRRVVMLQTGDFLFGGLENVIIDLARRLNASGFEAIVGTTGLLSPEGARSLADAGLEHVALPPSREQLTQVLRERRVALVNAHYSIALAEASHEAGIPFVQTLHSPYFWLDDAERERWQRADCVTAAYTCVSAIVACFADLNLGLSPSKMVVFPNGCHAATAPPSTPEESARLRAELGIGPDEAVFVNVGSLYPVKGQHLLLEAFAEIAPECPRCRLVFVGGQLREECGDRLRAFVTAHGLESQVAFVGRRGDVHRFLDLATALVMPSFSEGWSLAISEALRRGTPVVSTEVGAAVEQLRGTPGILLPAAFDDWRTLTLADFDQALLGNSGVDRVRRALADALRELATMERIPHRPTVGYGCQSPEEAYQRHVALFGHLLAGGAPRDLRWISHLPQRQSKYLES
ncbi:MAG: glycosyltransferase family 4 protein [Myxococcales bacterium]